MSDDSLNRPTQCGDEQTWHRFVAGQLPELQITSLRTHAETCSVCQAVVQRLRQSSSPPSNGFGKTAQETAKPVGDLSRTKLFQKEGHVPENAVQFEFDEAEFDESLLTKSERSDSIGKLGKYDILAVLGTGAFGVVLKAFDEQLRRSVAIKILNRQFASSATARRRFIREARAAAAVAHPCVVGIHAVEEQAGMPFLGGSAPMPSPSFFWTAPGLVPGEFCARHKLSLNTCNGCHAGETSTPFTHVGPRSQNFPASLSGFLLGITVNDPVDLATTHTFADLDRRVEDLNKLATCPCFFGISFVPLLMEH